MADDPRMDGSGSVADFGEFVRLDGGQSLRMLASMPVG
jgi:hypothetical protein